MCNKKYQKASERGNVLFLILIAVALFAALSYVVTQSTRSGGGSTEREKNILSSAQMTQYPTALRTSIIRLVLGGTGIENVKFDPPGTVVVSAAAQVFFPQGGGATYQAAPADVMAGSTGNTGTWYYNASFDVPGIGGDGVGGNDLIAFLPGVSQGVCKQANEELGITVPTPACTAMATGTNIPTVQASAVTETNFTTTLTEAGPAFPTLNQEDLVMDPGVGCTALNRQASGCFYDAVNNRFVFYSVLLER